MKRLSCFIFLLILIFSIGAVCASENATEDNILLEESGHIDKDIIQTNDDSSNILKDSDGSFSDLQTLINSKSYIELSKNYAFQDSDTSPLKINKGMVIDGKNHTIDAKFKSNILQIGTQASSNYKVTLKNIVFINAFSENEGGAITSYYNIAIENCTFKNNKALNGGAIYLISGTYTIKNSLFENNSASKVGGAIFDKTTDTYSAGVSSSIFRNNLAVLEGGAIYSRNLKVSKSTFENNKAYGAGGAIATLNQYTFYDNTFNNNEALVGNNLAFVEQKYTWYDIEVDGSDIYQFIQTEGRNPLNLNEFNLSNDFKTFYLMNGSQVSYPYYDDFIYVQLNGFNFCLYESNKNVYKFDENKWQEMKLTKLKEILDSYQYPYDNIEFDISKDSLAFSVNETHCISVDFKVYGVEFAYLYPDISDNLWFGGYHSAIVPKYGGPYYVSVDGDDSNNGSKEYPFKSIQKAIDFASLPFSVHKVIITEGVHHQYDLNITECDIEITGEGNAVIDGDGKGRIFTVSKNLKLSNIKLINGKTLTNIQYSSNELFDLYDNQFPANGSLNGFGGAIFAFNATKLNLNNVSFENNTANYGGAIFSLISIESLYSKFNKNIAHQGGAAIYTETAITLSYSNFTNNKVLKSLSGWGGAVYSININIDNSLFDNNTAAFGGAVFGYETVAEKSIFINNNASYGAAIFGRVWTIDCIIENCTGYADKGVFICEMSYDPVFTILEGQFIETNQSNYEVTATYTDEDGNPITGCYVNFLVNGVPKIFLPIINGTVSTTLPLQEGLNTISAEVHVSGYMGALYTWDHKMYTINEAYIVTTAQSYDGPIYVSPDGNDSNSGDENHPLKSLEKAIDLAVAVGSKVIMKEGIYYLHDINIFNEIEIVGQGKVIIDAESKGRIFKFDTLFEFYEHNASPSNLSNLILKNGDASKVSALDYNHYDFLYNAHYLRQINKDLGYGGAILAYSPITLDNVTFEDNHANLGGAIFAEHLNATNIKFINNSAVDYQNGVFINSETRDEGFEKLNYVNFDVSDHLYYHNYFKIPFTYENYSVFSTQEITDLISYGYLTTCMNFFLNSYNGEDVVEYLKILMFNHRNETNELQKAIWIFTDGQYWESTHSWIVETIKQYDAGNLIADNGTITLANGTQVEYDFKGIYGPRDYIGYYDYMDKTDLLMGMTYYLPYDQSNFILLKYNQTDNNITVSKETLNKTVNISDIVEFLITITNMGNSTISDAFIDDSDYDSSLKFVGWVSNVGIWTFDSSKMRWYLNETLDSGESRSLIIKFEALTCGELRNNVTAGLGDVVIANSTNTTNVTQENTTNTTNSTNTTNVTQENTTNTTNSTNTTDVETPDDDSNEDNYQDTAMGNDDSDDASSNEIKSNPKNSVDKNATGNPLLLLLFALVILPLRRKFKGK